MPFDPSQPFDVVSLPQVTRGSTFGWQNGPGSDPGDNGQFAGGGSSTDNPEDYAALPDDSGVPFGYTFPVTSQKTGKTVWVTRRDTGPAAFTGRGVDLAPSAMQKLGADTDEPLTIDTARAVPAFDPSQPFDVVSSKPATPPPAQATPPPAPDKSALDTAYAKEFPAQTADDGNKPWYARVYDTLTKRDNELMKLPVLDRIEQGALDAAEQIDPSGVIRSRLAGPTDFPLPRPFPESNPADSFLAASGKALANAPSDVANYVTSSGGAATLLGLGTLPAMSRALAANVFAAIMGNDAIEQLKRGDTQGAVESLAMAAAAGKGARDEFPLNEPKPAEPAPAESPETQPAPRASSGLQRSNLNLTPEGQAIFDGITAKYDAMVEKGDSVQNHPDLLAARDQELQQALNAPVPKAGPAPAEVQAPSSEAAPPEPAINPELGPVIKPEETQPNASSQPSAARIPGQPFRAGLDETAPFREQGAAPAESGATAAATAQRGADVPGDVATPERVTDEPEGVTTPGVGARHEILRQLYGDDVIRRGEGQGAQVMVDSGREAVATGRIDPYAVASKVQSGTVTSPEENGALIAEHENLANAAIRAGRIAEAIPTETNRAAYEELRQRAEDFAVNVLKPAATRAGDNLRVWQSVSPPDLTTELGMREAMRLNLDRELKPSEAYAAKKMASRNRAVDIAATNAERDFYRQLDRTIPRAKRIPTREEIGRLFSDIAQKVCDT